MTSVMIRMGIFVGIDLLLFLWPFSMVMVIDSKLQKKTQKRVIGLIILLECLTLLGISGVSFSGIRMTWNVSVILHICYVGMEFLSFLLAAVSTNLIRHMTETFIKEVDASHCSMQKQSSWDIY